MTLEQVWVYGAAFLFVVLIAGLVAEMMLR